MFVVFALIMLTVSLNDTTDCSYFIEEPPIEEPQPYDDDNSAENFIRHIEITCVIVGILINSAFIFTLYRVQDTMRTTTNIYLANLAVADCLLSTSQLIVFWTPITNRFSCGIPPLLFYMFSFVSVFFISLVALERYMAICKPALHRQTNSRTRAFRLSLTAWIASFVIVACHGGSISIDEVCIAMPKAPGFSIHLSVCQIQDWAYVSINMIDSCQFVLAFVGNCELYMCIVRRLHQRKCNEQRRIHERNHVAKMLAINACVFFILSTPIQILNLIKLTFHFANLNNNQLKTSELGMSILRRIAKIAFILNSAVNPLIYSAFNSDYRKAFRRAFTCTKRRRNPLPVQRRRQPANKEEEGTL